MQPVNAESRRAAAGMLKMVDFMNELRFTCVVEHFFDKKHLRMREKIPHPEVVRENRPQWQ